MIARVLAPMPSATRTRPLPGRVGIAGLVAVLASIPATAFAHPGHDLPDFIAGVMHPLTGIDHMMALLAAGFWAAQLGGKARLLLPTIFLAAMLGGSLLTGVVADPAIIEVAITASVIVLIAAVVLRLRPVTFVSVLMVGCFALAHGMAHALEAPSALRGSYVGGLLLASALLLTTGSVLAAMLRRPEQGQVR